MNDNNNEKIKEDNEFICLPEIVEEDIDFELREPDNHDIVKNEKNEEIDLYYSQKKSEELEENIIDGNTIDGNAIDGDIIDCEIIEDDSVNSKEDKNQSFESYKTTQKKDRKQTVEKVQTTLFNIIKRGLGLLVAMPLYILVATFGLGVIGVGGMGLSIIMVLSVLGLGVCAFFMSAGMTDIGMLACFVSLLGVGSSGFGLLVIVIIYKYFSVLMKKLINRKGKDVQEEGISC
ncbi:MAG: hypothetical protein ACRCSG_04270 [Cellulosilyticaceae bacterium]